MVNELLIESPLEVLSFGAFMILIADLVLRGKWSSGMFAAFVLIAAQAAQLYYIESFEPGKIVFSGLLYADSYAAFISSVIILGSLLAVLFGLGRLDQEGVDSPIEYHSLLLMSTAGAIIFANAAELITLFVGLEIMSMALYCLCGSALGLKRSSESALKYFFLGSFSSAFLLYGIALLYGLSGSTEIVNVAAYIANSERSALLLLSMGLVLVGLAFKIGAVPFHFWAPDVYEGAPTPVTAYMACVIKAAAVGAALRVLWLAFGSLVIFWSGFMSLLAGMTMILGNIVALRQRSLKRMLAYSSIAHAGYLLVAFMVPGDQYSGGAAALYYIVAYMVMTMGALGVVLAVTSAHASEARSDDISHFNGLGHTSPFLGVVMSLFMLSLAGIPPGMAGLLGKFYIFSAAIRANQPYLTYLTIIGVLSSAISCYYYLRVIVAMYFIESDGEEKVAPVGFSMAGALAICAVLVVVLGVFPSVLYDGVAHVISGTFGPR